MITRWAVILTIMFFVPVPICAGNNAVPHGHMARILLDERWNGKRIEMKVGDEIRIELQGTGAAGYAWHFDKLDQDLIQLKREESKEKAGESEKTVGSPVRHTWVVLAKRTGSSVIEMSYYRIWEGKDKSIQRFKVEVDIIP